MVVIRKLCPGWARTLAVLFIVLFAHARSISTSGLYGGIGYLYWKAQGDGLVIAAQSQLPIFTSDDTNNITRGNVTLREQEFHGAQGVRLYAGYEFCSGWDTALAWSRLADHTTTILPTTHGYDYVAFFSQPATINTVAFSNNAEGRWNYSFNTIEWLVSRSYTPCDALQITPCAGIMGARIRQCFVTSFYDLADLANNATILHVASFKDASRSNFGGVGIVCGLEGDWRICHHLSLTGLGKVALLAGAFDTSGSGTGTTYVNGSTALQSLTQVSDVAFHPHRVRPMAQLAIGVAADEIRTSFGILTFSAAFEAQYWPNQMMAQHAPSSLAFFVPQMGNDLMFYGLTVQCGVTF